MTAPQQLLPIAPSGPPEEVPCGQARGNTADLPKHRAEAVARASADTGLDIDSLIKTLARLPSIALQEDSLPILDSAAPGFARLPPIRTVGFPASEPSTRPEPRTPAWRMPTPTRGSSWLS